MSKISCISHEKLTPQIVTNAKLEGNILAVHYPTPQLLPDAVIKEELGISCDDTHVVIHQARDEMSFDEFSSHLFEREPHMKFV